MTDNYTKTILTHYYNLHKKYCLSLKALNELNKIKTRAPIMPEHISENIIKFTIMKYENIENCSWNCSGDLTVNNDKIECKSFSSIGPMSFGPTEKWKILYVLDSTNWFNDSFKLFKIKLSNDSDKFKNIKINKNQTFNEQCVQKRRPKISWNELKKTN